MKYAIRYYNKGDKVLSKANEVIIKYTETEDDLIRFSQEFTTPTQRLIANICGIKSDKDFYDSIDIFRETKGVHDNFAILLDYTEHYKYISVLL